MKEYRNLIDLYYHNIQNPKSEEPFIYNDGFVLTYRDTEQITNSLSRKLLTHVRGENHAVAIITDDVFVKTVCAISLIKINAIFVFLQPDDYDKLRAVSEKFNISVVCDNVWSVPPFIDAKTPILKLCREDLKKCVLNADVKPPKRRLTASQRENLPFRIQFTSGSTGEPKLNILQQFDIADCINTYRNELIEKIGISHFGQYLSVEYSYGIDSLFGAIYNGLPIYIFEEYEKKAINTLFEKIENANIDIVFLPASLVNAIAKTPTLITRVPDTLKVVFAGGESVRLTDDFVNELKFKNIRFAISYGCSEMQQVFYHIPKIECYDSLLTDPILGLPCHNCEAFVLDEQGSLVSEIGKEGRLIIGKKGKKYSDLHPLRRQNPKFILLPEREDEIYYDTSDKVKILGSGYAYCGRQERRIKIHGYWVELDSLQGTILQIPKIVSAFLTTFSDEFNNCRLALLYVGKVSEEEIVKYLGDRVQPHEMPAMFIRLEQLPLTTTYKTDAKQCQQIVSERLKECKNSRLNNETDVTPESRIKEIFSQYSMDVCANTDRSLDSLGIDSLILLIIICEIEKVFDIRLNIEEIDFKTNNTLNKMIDVIMQYL